MLDLNVIHRTQYCASGSVVVSRFLVGSLILIFASCLAGYLLMLLYAFAFSINVLLVVFVPIVVGLLIGTLVIKVIQLSHCRSPIAGSVLGLVCGLLVFASSCHILDVTKRCQGGGVFLNEVMRVDRLPEVINGLLHMRPNGEPEELTAPRINVPKTVVMLIELAILIWIPLNLGRDSASRAYFESARKWSKLSFVRAVPGSGPRLVESLAAGQELSEALNSVELCSDDPRPMEPKFFRIEFRKKGKAAATSMLLESEMGKNKSEILNGYLSVIEIDENGKRKTLIQQLKLLPSELAPASKLFLS